MQIWVSDTGHVYPLNRTWGTFSLSLYVYLKNYKLQYNNEIRLNIHFSWKLEHLQNIDTTSYRINVNAKWWSNAQELMLTLNDDQTQEWE